MKRNLNLLFCLFGLIQSIGAQPWISQGVGLLPHGYEVKSISVVSEKVLWVSASLIDQSNYPMKVFQSMDAGESWSKSEVPGCQGCTVTAIEGVDINIAWLTIRSNSGDGKLYKTEDGGHHWILKWSDPAAGGHIQIFDSIHLACFAYDHIGWSADGGETWDTGIIADPFTSLWPYSEGPGSAVGDTAWYGMTGDMYFSTINTSARLIRTTDNGHTVDFINCGLDSLASIDLISFSDHKSGLIKYTIWIEGFDPDLSDYGYVFSDQDYLARTINGGDAWMKIPTPYTKINAIHTMPGVSGTYLIAGDEYPSKISWTRNSGLSWDHYTLVDGACCIEFINPSTGWVAINGRSVEAPLVKRWNWDFTSAAEEISNDNPSNLKVYPNPVQDVILYSFTTKETTIHTASLTDITGHLVLKQTTENHEMNIAHLPTGMYFLSVQHEGQTEVMKIIKR